MILQTTNEVMYEKDEFIIAFIKESKTHKQIEIDLNTEGPCLVHIGLVALLDNLTAVLGVDKSRITIKTNNLVKSSDYTEICGYTSLQGQVLVACERMTPTLSNLSSRIGIFIGRSNWIRLGLASYIFSNCENPTMTFHYDSSYEYHRGHLGLNRIIFEEWADRHMVYALLDNVPMTYDLIQSYPIADDTVFNMGALYNDLFCEVICETFYNGNVFYPTEKIFRCMVAKRPFIVQGPKWFLKNLHILGFKTFNHWWPEAYDGDPEDTRYSTITGLIDMIESQEQAIINKWYIEMQPTLEHNYNMLVNMSVSRMRDTEFYVDS